MSKRSRKRVRRGGAPASGGDRSASTRSEWRPNPHLLAVAVILAATVVTYLEGAPDALVYDDRLFANPDRDLGWAEIHDAFTTDVWAAVGGESDLYRPLLFVSLAIDQWMFGDDVAAFHSTNVALHAVCSLLVYGLLVALLAGARPEDEVERPGAAWVPALVGALIFAVHPVHTDAVAAIFNRSEILVTLVTVGALWILWSLEPTRPRTAWALVGLLYFVGLLARESAATLPALAAVLLLVRSEGDAKARLRRIAPVLALLVPFAVYLAMRFAALEGSEASVEGLELGSRIRGVAAALAESARMMVWPHPLRITYRGAAPVAIGWVVLTHCAAAAIAVASYRRAPLVTVGLAIVYLATLPSTPLLRQSADNAVVSQHAMYLPSLGLAIALAGVAARIAWPWIGAAALVVAGGLGRITYDRTLDWHSELALYEAEQRVDPASAETARLLVSVYTPLPDRQDDALALCDRHASSPDPRLQNNCGALYDRIGRFEDAERAYLLGVASGFQGPMIHGNLSLVYLRLGRREEAEAAAARAVEESPDEPTAHYWRAVGLMRIHPERRDEAIAELEAALALRPSFLAAQRRLEQLRP